MSKGGNDGDVPFFTPSHATRRPLLVDTIMIGRRHPPPLFPFVSQMNTESVTCTWNQQIRLHNNFVVRSLRGIQSPISNQPSSSQTGAFFGFFTYISWPRCRGMLNLDTTQDDCRERRRQHGRRRPQCVRPQSAHTHCQWHADLQADCIPWRSYYWHRAIRHACTVHGDRAAGLNTVRTPLFLL